MVTAENLTDEQCNKALHDGVISHAQHSAAICVLFVGIALAREESRVEIAAAINARAKGKG